MTRLIYATRKSALALAQCRALVARLQSLDASLELEELQVVTSGDRITDVPLSEVGGKGLFVKEIEEALLEGRADLAVHSMKDVPSLLPTGLEIVCIPQREDPRDALVSPRFGTLASLPEGATVGTSSLRRAVALKAARGDLRIVSLRGNVDTRLRKVDSGDYDAIVLARAGLVRLGLAARATEVLAPEVMLPAVGQGALGIECKTADAATRARLVRLHDVLTARCVAAERGVMVALEGDCRTPLAAYAEHLHGEPASGGATLRLRAFIADSDGTRMRTHAWEGAWPRSDTEAHDIGLDVGRTLGLRA